METDAAKILIQFAHAPVLALGPGRRAGIWLRGCSIHCPGCMSDALWSFDRSYEKPVSEAAKEILAFFESDGSLDGVTVSGGEPFDQGEAVVDLLKKLRAGGVRDILIYTGYGVDSVCARFPEIGDLAAAMVDGPFKLGRETEAGWKGSANQTLRVFADEFAGRYKRWQRTKKGKLQMAVSMGRVISVGIPRQKDVPNILAMVAARALEEAGNDGGYK
ncbi:MAG: radical SAM protein [Synergistaceae bacterium]|jgi:anaerobic ribonucleoside-triphosphate reductase activating protein|nr:radical SAM protein [Synergistaceae bacterium]